MAHASRSTARRYRRLRRKHGDDWDQAKWDAEHAPPGPVQLLRRGEPVEIERSRANMRRDLFTYDGDRITGLTTLATYQGYRLP